jgi:adenylate cyclase
VSKEDGRLSEGEWCELLSGTSRHQVLARRTLGLIPSSPRCRFCSLPFHGPGGFLLRRISDRYGPWEKNPNLCRRCISGLGSAEVVGGEIDVSFLFADVRRSSELARRLGDRDFTSVMQRFYSVATETLFSHDALLDKFVGDEVVGFFLPFMAGERHAARAVDAAGALLRGVGYGSEAGAWLPLGAAVHTGRSFVGFVSRGLDSEFTAFGTTINVAAHLAAEARAGETLITEAVRVALEADGLERRHLSLKGQELDAYVLPAAATAGRAEG